MLKCYAFYSDFFDKLWTELPAPLLTPERMTLPPGKLETLLFETTSHQTEVDQLNKVIADLKDKLEKDTTNWDKGWRSLCNI